MYIFHNFACTLLMLFFKFGCFCTFVWRHNYYLNCLSSLVFKMDRCCVNGLLVFFLLGWADCYRWELCGLSVCLSVCWSRSWAMQKTAELIRMWFGELTCVGPSLHVLDEVEIHHGKGQLLGVVRPIKKHWESLLWCTQLKWPFGHQ